MEALQEQWVSINGYLGKVLKREVFCKAKIASWFFFILALKNNLRAKLCCACSAPERHLTALACGFSTAVCTQGLQVRLRSQGRGSAPPPAPHLHISAKVSGLSSAPIQAESVFYKTLACLFIQVQISPRSTGLKGAFGSDFVLKMHVTSPQPQPITKHYQASKVSVRKQNPFGFLHLPDTSPVG